MLVNGLPIHTAGTETEHCGGLGSLQSGSNNVLVGEGSDFRRFLIRKQMVSTPIVIAVEIGRRPEDIFEIIKDFRHGVREGLQELLTASLERLIGRAFRLVDRIAFPLGSILEHVTLTRGAGIPFLSEVLPWLRTILKTQVNLLFDGRNAMELNGACPAFVEVGLPENQTRESLIFSEAGDLIWGKIVEANVDVSDLVERLLFAFRPVFVVDREDFRALSFQELLSHSNLHPLPGGRKETPTSLVEYNECLDAYPLCGEGTCEPVQVMEDERRDPRYRNGKDLVEKEGRGLGSVCTPYLEIDDDFAMSPGNDVLEEYRFPDVQGPTGYMPKTDVFMDNVHEVYYGRAIKNNSNSITLLYMALRTISLTADSTIDLRSRQHQGDSETVEIHLERAAAKEPWLLAYANYNSELHYQRKCEKSSESPLATSDTRKVQMVIDAETNRPMVFVARGSHALGPESGARKLTSTGLTLLDYYPEVKPDRLRRRYTLLTTATDDVRRAVFTAQVIWGVPYVLFAKMASGPGYKSNHWKGKEEYAAHSLDTLLWK